MTYQVKKTDLYQSRYHYVWDDSAEQRHKHTPYMTVKVDINNGYAVLDIIQSIYNHKNYVFCGFVSIYEQLLHNLDTEQMRSLEEIKQTLMDYL